MEGDSVIITVSAQDSTSILKLNHFSFAGATLAIRLCESSSPSRFGKQGEKKKEELSDSAKETHDRIQAILGTRYDPNLKLLNLSALGQDPGLVEMGFFTENQLISKLFPVLMVVCDRLFSSAEDKRNAIVSVILADNELASVSTVNALAQTFPDLKNLDLSRNKFTELRSLEAWRWRFRQLENLVITNNPIETLSPDFKIEILQWFPKLQFLNGIQVRTPEEVTAAAEAAKSPIPLNGPDFRDVGQVGENFFRQFVNLYDNDRAALAASFYDAQSIHSISINMSAPRDLQHSVPIPPWAAYTKHSRNLTKVTHLNTRMSRQCRGVEEIQSLWSSLPVTRHPDLLTQADKYLIDCHRLPGLSDPTGQSARGVDGLIISSHGEFEERSTSITDKALRSFSRTFVLGPGAPGGPPIRVVSDIMILRAWAPLTLPPNLAAKNNTTTGEEQKQQEVTMQLVNRTGMTTTYALMCLTETGWDLEKALIAFDANRVR